MHKNIQYIDDQNSCLQNKHKIYIHINIRDVL